MSTWASDFLREDGEDMSDPSYFFIRMTQQAREDLQRADARLDGANAVLINGQLVCYEWNDSEYGLQATFYHALIHGVEGWQGCSCHYDMSAMLYPELGVEYRPCPRCFPASCDARLTALSALSTAAHKGRIEEAERAQRQRNDDDLCYRVDVLLRNGICPECHEMGEACVCEIPFADPTDVQP